MQQAVESIEIRGLRITGHHGVLEQERRVGNEFSIDIVVWLADVAEAMENDSLAHTVNYADIVAIVKEQMALPSKLLEHVAARIRRAICARFTDKISGGEVTVAKLAPPIPAQLDYVSFTTRW